MNLIIPRQTPQFLNCTLCLPSNSLIPQGALTSFHPLITHLFGTQSHSRCWLSTRYPHAHMVTEGCTPFTGPSIVHLLANLLCRFGFVSVCWLNCLSVFPSIIYLVIFPLVRKKKKSQKINDSKNLPWELKHNIWNQTSRATSSTAWIEIEKYITFF